MVDSRFSQIGAAMALALVGSHNSAAPHTHPLRQPRNSARACGDSRRLRTRLSWTEALNCAVKFGTALSTGGDRLSAFPARYLLVSEPTLSRPCLSRDTTAQLLPVPSHLRS